MARTGKGPDTRVNLDSIRHSAIRGAARWAPMGLYSSVVGWGARTALPRRLRRPLFTAFARAVGADLGEPERDLAEYPSLGDFFARRLRGGARPLATGPGAILCPCDGVVAAAGPITLGTLVEAKGHAYQVGALLADPTRAAAYDGGWYATIYLSPANYHRVHAPVAGRVVRYDYVPGAQLPVNPRFADAIDDLLAINERAVIWLEGADQTQIPVVLVGAAAVGNIWLSHLPGAEGLGDDTRRFRAAGEARRVDIPPVGVGAGDELGAFLLGSTVVVLMPPGAGRLALRAGEVVRQGQRMGGISA
jgi:phosphatidylserine decarboxylase